MSTFRAALRGTSWALGAQVFIAAGQIAYSGLTARLFSPHVFGEFTAAVGLQGLIGLCTATGVASFVLKEAHLRRSQLRAVNIIVFSLGLLGAAVYWFASPLWLGWLNAPGGSQFVPLLAWATFASPIGTVQWALLRREGDGRADWIVFVSAFVLANGAAALCAILSRESWSLALATAINPIFMALFSRVLRRAVYPVDNGFLFDWLVFALRVTGQNLVFFGFGQVPTWSLGASTTPAVLGQFSRGNVLAQLPTSALGAALSTGLQPHWRKIESNESRFRAVSEALVLGSSMSFVISAVLASLSRPLTILWLGPGWDLAAEFTTWLAIGFAMLVPTVQLANYLEMTGALPQVHWIQLANAAGLALGVALLAWLHDFRLLLAGFVLSHFLGLTVAVSQVSKTLGSRSGQLLRQLVAPLFSAMGAAGVAYAVSHLVGVGALRHTTLGNAGQLIGGALGAALFIFLTRKWHPALSILVARGVLKRA